MLATVGGKNRKGKEGRKNACWVDRGGRSKELR